MHRLLAIADSLDGPPEDGQSGRRPFARRDAPVAFDVAELELGEDLVIELPDPGEEAASRRACACWRSGRPRSTRYGSHGHHEMPPGARRTETDDRAVSVGSQIDLLAAQEELRDVRIELEQTQAELTRARDHLRAERERRAGDSERFRDGLAKVRESAEEALAAEQGAARQLDADLQEAHAAIATKDADLESAAQAARGGRCSASSWSPRRWPRRHAPQARGAARGRGEETERLRAELRRGSRSTRRRDDRPARNDVERLLDRLTAVPAT